MHDNSAEMLRNVYKKLISEMAERCPRVEEKKRHELKVQTTKEKEKQRERERRQ